MADISDVEIALRHLVDTILYPNGDSAASLTGDTIRIMRGWPNAKNLDNDLANGVHTVSVFPQPGFTRLTDGYLDQPTGTPATPSLTVTVSGASVTIGGTPGLGQLVGVIVDGKPYAYACTATDTLASTAAALAALTGGGMITDFSGNQISGLVTQDYATVSGSTITFATNRPIVARVSATGTSQQAPAWEVAGILITVWAATPGARDAICKPLDVGLKNTPFIQLSDATTGRLLFRNSYVDDVPQREQLWKRSFIYTVQFANTITQPAPQVLFGIENATTLSRTVTTVS